MGLYGLGVNNLLSVNLVMSGGEEVKIDPSNTELWWAIRGAGPNFGIVTSATLKSHPVSAKENGAWAGSLIFTQDKIEAIVQAINDLDLQPRLAIFLYFAKNGPPNHQPAIIAVPFYKGADNDGKAAFSSIYAVGPIVDTTTFLPYNKVNAGGDSFCVKGGRKPSYGAGLDPSTWRAIWKEYLAFLQNPETGNSVILAECYSMSKAKSLPDSSSAYPFRSTVKFNAVAMTWYGNSSLDAAAEAFGSKVRDLWRSTDNLASDST